MNIRSKNFVVVLRHIEGIPERVQRASAVALTRGLEYARTISQREFLSGPRPARLDVVTTRLRQSIAINVRSTSRGIVGRIGSNVKYAAFHEFGLRGAVQVRGFTRHIQDANWQTEAGGRRTKEIRDRAGNVIGRKRESVEEATKRGVAFTSQFVGAHSRKVNYAGRPFIKPALEKARPVILATLKEELAKEARG